MTTDDLEAAWAAVHDAMPPDLVRGSAESPRRVARVEPYAFDQREQPTVGVSRAWTAIGATEAECLLEMARCLRFGAGRVPP